MAAVAALSGCHAYHPIQAAPRPGATLAFVLSDQGRVDLGPTVGQGAELVEGTLERASDSGYVLQVRVVDFIDGRTDRWSGERVTIRPQGVAAIRERRFSRRRTLLAAAAGIGGAALFVATRSLLGRGGGEREPPDRTPPDVQ